MKLSNPTLLEFMTSYHTIPIYQRNYSWEKKNIARFLSDIKETAEKNKKEENYDHFFGTIVTSSMKKKSDSNIVEKYILDGQQRIVTVVLIFIALCKKALEEKNEEKINNYLTYIGHKKLNFRDLYRVTPNKGDTVLTDLFKYCQEKKGDEIEALLQKNQKHTICKNLLIILKAFNDEESLREDMMLGLGNFNVVVLQVEKENPQLIFETINSTGVELSQSDFN